MVMVVVWVMRMGMTVMVMMQWWRRRISGGRKRNVVITMRSAISKITITIFIPRDLGSVLRQQQRDLVEERERERERQREREREGERERERERDCMLGGRRGGVVRCTRRE
jgi:uncharacterized membrane protein